MQPLHLAWATPDRSDTWSLRLGRERSERCYPIRTLLESGATLTFGSDWPVTRADWREGLAWAQLRRAPGATDAPPLDDQGIDALAALHAYTVNPAIAVGEGSRLGRIRPGWLADLTVLAQDPVDTPADEIVDVPILLTVVDGEIVFRAGALEEAGAL